MVDEVINCDDVSGSVCSTCMSNPSGKLITVWANGVVHGGGAGSAVRRDSVTGAV